MAHLVSLRIKRGMTDGTRATPTHTHTNTQELSRVSNCSSILVHPHFHACAFKITNVGAARLLSTDTIPFSEDERDKGLEASITPCSQNSQSLPKAL